MALIYSSCREYHAEHEILIKTLWGCTSPRSVLKAALWSWQRSTSSTLWANLDINLKFYRCSKKQI